VCVCVYIYIYIYIYICMTDILKDEGDVSGFHIQWKPCYKGN